MWGAWFLFFGSMIATSLQSLCEQTLGSPSRDTAGEKPTHCNCQGSTFTYPSDVPTKTKQRTPRILAPSFKKTKKEFDSGFPTVIKRVKEKKKVPDKMHELYLTNWFHTMSQTVSSLHANSWLFLILPPNLLLHDFAPKATCKNLGLGSRKWCC